MPLALRIVACYATAVLAGLTVLARHPVAAAAPLVAAFVWAVHRSGEPGAGSSTRRFYLRLAVLLAVAVAGVVVGSAEAARTVGARTVRREPPGLLLPIRDAAVRSIEQAFGSDAPLAKALLVADRRELPLEIRDRFAAAGLAHILSISGLHVGIAAISLELFARVIGVGPAASRVVTLVLLGGYVLMLGAPPPALRAASMFAAVSFARGRGRPTSPWSALAFGAAVPLIFDPRSVVNIGWQLSAAGVASLIAARQIAARLAPDQMDGWRRSLLDAALASTIASFASSPIVAWHFGRVSLVGPVANLFAAPVIAVLQPTLFLALVLSPVPTLSSFVAGAAHPLLWALNFVAERAALLPASSVYVAPTIFGAIVSTGVVLSALAAFATREYERPAIVTVALLAVLFWSPRLPGGSGRTELHVIDVGQGDAIALRTARGRWLLFDAGRAWRGGDAGRAAVVPHLRRRGGGLVAFILSHPHTDHVGGASTVVRALKPAYFYDPGFVAGAAAYREALAAVAEGRARTRWRRVRPGDSLKVDEAVVRFLAPDSAWAASLRDPNDASTVALIEVGRVRFLLTGDAENGEENWLLSKSYEALRADVLKVGHHGSRTSSDSAFVAAVRPRVAVISVGAGNGYGHPSPETLRTLESQGVEVMRTDRDGTVILETDGRHLFAKVDGVRWRVEESSRR
jgi:competence protein ComEC